MVTDAIVNACAAVAAFVLGLIHLPDVPSWVEGMPDALAGIGSYVSGIGVWVPWPVIGAVLTAWGVVMVATVGVKVLRIAISHIPFVGGTA